MARLGLLPAAVLWLFVLAACGEKDAPPSVDAPRPIRTCGQDSDCALIPNSCDGCCSVAAARRSDSAAFARYRDRVCEGYEGPACECCYMPRKAACEDGLCEVVLLSDKCILSRN